VSLGLGWERHEATASAPRDTTTQKQIESMLGFEHFNRKEPTTFADGRYGLGADSWFLTLEVHERQDRATRLGFGLAGGVLIPRGEIELSYSDRDDVFSDLSGRALVFHGYATVEAYPTALIGLTTLVGLRVARVPEVQTGRRVLLDTDDSSTHIDYSGIYVLVGIKIHLGIQG
jgi:hypothetical protein